MTCLARFKSHPFIAASDLLFCLIALPMSYILAAIYASLSPKKRAIVFKNLAIIYGQGCGKNAFFWAILTYADFIFSFLHTLFFSILSLFFAKGICRYIVDTVALSGKGIAGLHSLLTDASPIVFLTGHFSNFLLSFPILQANGREVMVILKRPRNTLLVRLIDFLCRRLKIGRFYIDEMYSIRQVVSGLKRGAALVVLADQHFGRRGNRTMDLFGKPVRFAAGHLRLASMAKARVITAFFERMGFFCYRLLVCDVSERVSDERSALSRYVRHIESEILRRPHQWSLMHNRWKDA